MRINPEDYDAFNNDFSQVLRLVVKIDFPTPLYLTSHSGIPNIPANRIDGCLKDVSSTSQRLNPDQGRSEIGSISFQAVDINGEVSTEFRIEEGNGNGLNGRGIELYRGGEGMDWSDFRLEQTQQIDGDVTLDGKAYKIQCADVQRAMRKDLFDAAKTALSANFLAAATTLEVFDTDDFEPCSHVASFGQQPTGSFFYLKIKYSNGFEIVRATGKTATTFTGVARGQFGTRVVDHVYEVGTDGDDGIEVTEYVYLELPAPAMAYALLTGNIIGGGTLPSRWNLGIPTGLVNEPSFEDIGEDWFDSSDYSKGLIFRFQGVPKADGKRFIEREVCLLAGAFMLITADGKVNMRRMTGVIGTADFVTELDSSIITKHSAVKYNLNRVRNLYDVTWAMVDFPNEDKPRFVRRNILVDATSVALHGEAKPLALKFQGLHNERHTYTTLINRFDALRDRYAGPPITMKVDLMPSANNLEVGDIVRVMLDNLEDYSDSGTMDRSFEIQRITVNQKSGKVTAQLFGSTLKADPIPDTGAGVNSELPDGWYSSEGTEMVAAGLTIGAGIMTASGTLTGGTTTRTIFYYLGDLTINSGVTLYVSGNTELRIRGHLQVNGTISATGGRAANTAGFIGMTYGGPGMFLRGSSPYPPNGTIVVYGQNAAMPVLEIENNAGVLDGIPADMRGSGGGKGGSVWYKEDIPWLTGAIGGNGGGGAGSTVLISRGAAYGVAGRTRANGGAGNTGGTFTGHGAGSGGGGAPGCLVHLLDGSGVTFPVLFGKFLAVYGTSPITNSEPRTQGKARASDPIDLSVSNARVQYVPKSRDPYPEYQNDELGEQDGLSTYTASVYIRSATAPATPTTDEGSYNFDTNVLTAPSGGWSVVVPSSDGNPLYVSRGTFQIQGITGTDSTVVWTAPAISALDGVDGGTGQRARTVTIFRKNSNSISSASGTFADPLAGNGSWSYDVPALTADGDTVYVAVRTLTDDAAAPEDAAWGTPTVYSQRTDGVDGGPGTPGADAQLARTVTIFRLNSNSINSSSGTFADPLDGNGSWSYSVPALASDGDSVYVAVRTLTDDAAAPQDGTWSTPTIYSQRTDGTDGADAINSRYPTIYRLNSNTISSTSGTFADPLAGNGSWSYSVPTMTTDGDIVYAASRILTSDAQAPQEANWSTPAIYAQRTDGSDGGTGGTGPDGQSTRTAHLYKLNDSTLTSSTGGTFADPIAGNTDWSYSVPALGVDNDQVYVAVRTFTSDAAAPQDASWTTPVIYAQRTDGLDGDDGVDAVDTRYPTIYRLNSSTISSSSGTFADPLAGNGSWSYSVPALASDGDVVYSSTRRLTADGLAPQDANWSTPTIYAQRTDGSDGGTGGTGPAGQEIRTVNIYRLNSSTISSTSGTFADPLAGNTSWSYAVPALASDGDVVYVAVRTLTDDAASPQDTNWSTPVAYAVRTDGSDGGTGPTGDDGADGRDGVVIGGVKPNFGSFSGANDGEMYIHGLNAAGVPADVDGSFIFEGARVTLSKGYIYTNAVTINGGYLVLETGAGTPFTTASVSAKMAACRVVLSDGAAQWQYDNNTAWTNFTETDTMIIFGQYNATTADLIDSATLTAPIPLASAVINAAQINAANLSAISATIGQLETRPTGGSPTTPRLVIADAVSPMMIFDTDDVTPLLELTNTNDGFRIGILGDFIANSINSSQMFSVDGIDDLRGRLGLSAPGGGTGGSLSIAGSTAAYSGTLNVDKNILIDQLPQGGGTGDIESGGNDVTLFWKLYYSSQGFTSGLPGFSAGQWTCKLQYKKNTDGWVNVPGASWVVTGNLQVWGNGSSEPYEWSYNVNEERSIIWTGALALNDYVYRIAIQCDSGSTLGNITIGTANEPLSGAGVLEDHTHEADEIVFGVLADARIPSLNTSKTTAGTFANARISSASITQYTAALYAPISHNHSGADITTGLVPKARIDGDVWRHISSGYASAEVTVAGTAPGSPSQGDIWFDTAAAASVSKVVTPTGYTLEESTATYGGLNVAGPAKGGYYGIQLASELTFMWSGSVGGLYNHDGADWVLQHTRLAGVRLYYGGAEKLETLTGGIEVTGNITVSGTVDGVTITNLAPKASPTFSGTITNAGTLTTTAAQHRFNTPDGYIEIGPKNSTWGHIYTDRANFYFNKGATMVGHFLPSATNTYNLGGSSSEWNHLYVTNIQLASTDCTLTRLAAGQLAVEGKAVPYHATAGYTRAKISVASTAPSSPSQGDIWFDTS